MILANTYMNTWASMMNLVTRFRQAYPQYNFLDQTIDFDNVDGENLPKGNLIGIYQFDFTVDDGLIYAQCTFPISTEKDTNSVELNKAVGDFVNFVSTNSMHQWYDYQTKSTTGFMKASNKLSVSPMVNTKSRQYKFIAQMFALDRTTGFPQP